MRFKLKLLFAVVALLAAGIVTAHAVEPDEVLSDPALEARARAISANLRCVVCLNQSIDSSNAGVARDLRLLVRRRLKSGETDEEVYAFVVARYGDYVLLNPPFKPKTYVLWLLPAAFAAIGIGTAAIVLLRARKNFLADPPALSDNEQIALETMTGDKASDEA